MPATWCRTAPLSPLHRRAREASTPARTASPCFGPEGYHPPKSRSVLVVSHHLDGFLRFMSCGLVASRCRSWGPPRFGAGRPTGRPERRDASPQCRIRTLRRTPRRQPRCVTAAVAFLPFPRDHRRCSRPTVAGVTSAAEGGSKAPAPRPCSIVGSGIGPHRFRRGRPAPSWASFLFKVLPDGRRSRLPPASAAARAPEGEARRPGSVPHPTTTPAEAEVVGRAPHPRRTARAGALRPKGQCLVPRRHTIRRPRTAAAYATGPASRPEARLGTGATPHARRGASGPDPGRNPFERSPRAQVHCAADRASKPAEPGSRRRKQACEPTTDAVEVYPEPKFAKRSSTRRRLPCCRPALLRRPS
jgi:hypothetical protein